MCEHFGHTVDVHRNFYKARSDVLERTEIAKILLMQDFGQVKNFVGKKLKDIQFTGEPSVLN